MTSRRKGQDKGPQTSGGAGTFFANLPIFRLNGGTEELRDDFVRRLMAELTQHSLTGVYLRRSDQCTPSTLLPLVRRHDLVLVNDGADTPEQPITIDTFDKAATGMVPWSLVLAGGWPGFLTIFLNKLADCSQRTPVWGCVLIGGKSSRMGRPKHLLTDSRGKTWLENTLAALRPLVEGIVVSGGGALPGSLADTIRLPDIPGIMGPLTGIVAAGRWQPLVSWLLVACDMPYVSAEAAAWLLAGRRPGCWGRVPRFSGNDRLEPLLAWYDFRSMHLFEDQLYGGSLRIGEAAGHSRIEHPVIPENLCYAWENINTPEHLQTVRR